MTVKRTILINVIIIYFHQCSFVEVLLIFFQTLFAFLLVCFVSYCFYLFFISSLFPFLFTHTYFGKKCFPPLSNRLFICLDVCHQLFSTTMTSIWSDWKCSEESGTRSRDKNTSVKLVFLNSKCKKKKKKKTIFFNVISLLNYVTFFSV